MRVLQQSDLHARRFQARNGIRRWGLDEIDLAREQGRRTGRGFRHGEKHQPVMLRHAGGVPVIRVLHEFEALAGHGAGEFIGPGTHRRLGVFLVVVVHLLERAFRDHEHHGHVVGEDRLFHLRVDGDRVVVDLFVARDVRGARTVAREMHHVELRCLVIGDAGNAPERGIGIPRAAIVEFHIPAQLEDPALVIFGIDVPLGREPSRRHCLAIRAGEIPIQQAVIEREADKALALRTLIGMTRPVRDIASRHGHAQRALRLGRRNKSQTRKGGQGQAQAQRSSPFRLARHSALRCFSPGARGARTIGEGTARGVPEIINCIQYCVNRGIAQRRPPRKINHSYGHK